MRYVTRDEDRDSYPGLVIRNRWGKSKYVGFCYKGWFMMGNGFSSYLMQYAVNLYGIPEYAKYLKKIPGRNFIFMIPDAMDEEEINLLSEELFNLELKRILDGEETTEEIKQNVFYPEMVKRGYVDILNKK